MDLTTNRYSSHFRMDNAQEKSKGHLAFIGGFEFYERNGRVYKAPLDAVIALDTKQRHGRDEGSLASWDSIKTRYEKVFS